MNKNDLIAHIADAAELSKTDAGKAVDAVFAAIAAALTAGDEVKLVGFGVFSVEDRPERTGRNPQNGAEIVIAASKAPKFKPGKELKAVVNA